MSPPPDPGPPEPGSPDRSSSSAGADRRPAQVFVVDDHPAIREIIASRAEDLDGIEVVGESAGASRGLTEIEARRPDVAVVEISLGGIDGLTLTRNIRSEVPETRVLVFSMYEETIYARRALRVGASGYLSKSRPIDEVMEAIRSISEGGMHVRRNMLTDILDDTLRGEEGPAESGLHAFTDREMTVFQMLGDGDTVQEIAERLDLSRKTVETYRRRAKKKLGCETVHELVRYAVLWTRDGRSLTAS